jgi:hypothetical protein
LILASSSLIFAKSTPAQCSATYLCSKTTCLDQGQESTPSASVGTCSSKVLQILGGVRGLTLGDEEGAGALRYPDSTSTKLPCGCIWLPTVPTKCLSGCTSTSSAVGTLARSLSCLSHQWEDAPSLGCSWSLKMLSARRRASVAQRSAALASGL